MNIVKRIDQLCQERGTNFAEVERKTGLSNGSIRRWATNVPSTDKIQKIADYFNVSLDYLQGRTDYRYVISDKGKAELDPDIELIQRARSKMDDKQKNKMMELLRLSFDDAFEEEDKD